MNRRRVVGAGGFVATVAFAVALAEAGGVARRRIAGSRVDDVPLGRYRVPVDERVGADYPHRHGLAGERVLGEMDDLDAFARADFDTGRVAPVVRDFYERTSEYRMTVTAEWHRPFRTGATLASPLTARIEQLNLPGPREPGRVRVVESELFRVDETKSGIEDSHEDPREDTRFWVRTDVDTGEAVFVAVYGSHVGDGERFVNIAVPLPGGTLSTVLGMRALELDGRDDVGVHLTTRASGHPGLFWSTRRGDWRLPMHQVFRTWPAKATLLGDATVDDGPDVDGGPDVDVGPDVDDGAGVDDVPAVDVEGALAAAGAMDSSVASATSLADAVVATHEMWLLGRRFLTVRYVAFPCPDA